MTNFTHLSSLNVQGSVETSTQGKLVGSFTTMPAPSALNAGQIVLYTGETGTYTKGKFYVSTGIVWELSEASPETVVVDSALSSTSTNPVQNKVVNSAIVGLQNNKQDKLTIDSSPVSGSGNPVSSGGVYNGLAGKQNALTFDSAPTNGSSNPVTSTGIYTTVNTKVPASGSYDADTSTITFKAASGAQLFQVTGIEGGGVQFTLKVTYTGAPDLSGISVTATPVTGATATVQGTTNSSGIAYLSVKQDATYKITSSKTGYTFTSSPEVSCTDLTTEASISCYVPGTVTITVTDEKASVVGRTVTATASGQTTQTKTVASGQTSVTFSLPAGTWTFKSDYPSGATGSTSITQVVENNGIYSGTISIVYIRVFGYILTKSQSDPSKKVSYPETIFGYTNAAASVAKATAVGSPGGWANVQDTLITGIVDETFNGDAMVYVQDSWYKRKEKDSSGNEYVAFANTLPDKESSKWEDLAGSVDGVRIGHFRVGKYLTSSNNRSVSGSTPQVNTSITDFISYAQSRTYDGHPYDIMTKDQYEYFVDLLPMIFGTTNLQTIMRGYVDGNSEVTTSAVLSEDTLGMAGSSSDGRMSALHVNDLWGNAYQFVGGARTDSSCNLWVRNGLSAVSDPTTANGWEKACDAVLVSTSGYIDDVAGTNKAGNFPISKGGSSSTHFADYGFVSASHFPVVGGYCSDAGYAGPFYESFGSSATDAGSRIGSRISYRY